MNSINNMFLKKSFYFIWCLLTKQLLKLKDLNTRILSISSVSAVRSVSYTVFLSCSDERCHQIDLIKNGNVKWIFHLCEAFTTHRHQTRHQVFYWADIKGLRSFWIHLSVHSIGHPPNTGTFLLLYSQQTISL